MKKIVLGCAAVLLSLGLLAGCNDNPSTVDAVIINVDSSASVVVGETLELPYSVEPEKATVVAASDHEEYVTADAQDGILYLHGVTEGSAIVTLVGTYKKYAEANVNINVSVVTEADEKTEPGTQQPGTTHPAPTGEEDPAYFGFEVDGVGYYITGETVSGYTYEGSVTTSVEEAVLVSIEKGTAENEFYLSFGEESNVKYITIIETTNSDGKTYTNLSYAEEKAPIYWNETYGCWGNEAATHFLCYNSRYGCLYCSDIESYIESSPIATLIEPAEVSELTIVGATEVYENASITLRVIANLGASNSVAWTVESKDSTGNATVENGVVTGVSAGVVTVTATSTENEGVSASVDITVNAIPTVLPFELDKPYWFGYEYSNKTYYFAGAITASYYGEVIATEGAGTEVIVSEVEGGYTLGFTDANGQQQYISLSVESYVNFGISTSAFVWQYDYSMNTFVADLSSETYYIGNYYNNSTTYNELRAMKLSEYGSSDANTYCVAHLIEPPVPTSLVISGSSTVEVTRSTLLTVVDEQGRSTPVTWASSSEEVATVSDAGVVTGVSEGTATITATSTRDTSIRADFSITVTAYVEKAEVKIGTYDFTTKDENYDQSNKPGNSATDAYSSGDALKATFDTYWVGEESYTNPLASIDSTSGIYNYYTSGGLHANEHGLLKTGTSSVNGEIAMTLNNTITKVEVDQQSWSTSENCTITVNTISHESASKGVQETLSFDIAETTTLSMTFAKRCYIFAITLYGYVD